MLKHNFSKKQEKSHDQNITNNRKEYYQFIFILLIIALNNIDLIENNIIQYKLIRLIFRFIYLLINFLFYLIIYSAIHNLNVYILLSLLNNQISFFSLIMVLLKKIDLKTAKIILLYQIMVYFFFISSFYNRIFIFIDLCIVIYLFIINHTNIYNILSMNFIFNWIVNDLNMVFLSIFAVVIKIMMDELQSYSIDNWIEEQIGLKLDYKYSDFTILFGLIAIFCLFKIIKFVLVCKLSLIFLIIIFLIIYLKMHSIITLITIDYSHSNYQLNFYILVILVLYNLLILYINKINNNLELYGLLNNQYQFNNHNIIINFYILIISLYVFFYSNNKTLLYYIIYLVIHYNHIFNGLFIYVTKKKHYMITLIFLVILLLSSIYFYINNSHNLQSAQQLLNIANNISYISQCDKYYIFLLLLTIISFLKPKNIEKRIYKQKKNVQNTKLQNLFKYIKHRKTKQQN